ncbi:MAG: 4-(cytidine 5'-diphospho)-2-C-methyl-D-erythritol kinase [Propionibacteriaceae bacterium]|nr:4-(cytidine 5'-diphospho)-2-C-methyl-D-erythritol kinase [Propionibacteriaceae bacterium]
MVRVRVPGKVNLALAVGQTDARGYHELGTVFQAVSLFDELLVRPAPPGKVRLGFDGEGAAELPRDDSNLVTRAARLLASNCGVTDGVEIRVSKRIPVAGGMAGGSANAAAALVACNELWQLGLDQPQLHALARQLGADVPFLLYGGTAIGTGYGDRIEPIPTEGRYYWVLAFSHHGLATPDVFREFDRTTQPQSTAISPDLLAALAAGDIPGVGRLLSNDLQDPALRLSPELAAVLQLGRDAGAAGGVVSGSGPTVAFLAHDARQAAKLGDRLAADPQVREVHLAEAPAPGAQLLREEAMIRG